MSISIIILTYNEEKHIDRCINSAKKISENVFIVDSFSTDRTIDIANCLGAQIFQNPWQNNQARQFNWALDNLPINTEWVLRLDADEYLSDDLIEEIKLTLSEIESNVCGIVMKREIFFMGKIIRYGNVKWNMLRLFRYKKGYCENRWMDEHIVLSSDCISKEIKGSFYDHNLNSLTWWINKHNNYSIREAVDLLDLKYCFLSKESSSSLENLSKDAEIKRNRKKKYNKMPLFFRSLIYFFYRYFFKLGFLDGKEGFLWHFFQGLWYRMLVDAKVYEIRRECGNDREKIKRYLEEEYGFKF